MAANFPLAAIARFLPQIYSTLIINNLYLYGTKMFPQFK